jgi:hypothetical protein
LDRRERNVGQRSRKTVELKLQKMNEVGEWSGCDQQKQLSVNYRIGEMIWFHKYGIEKKNILVVD